MAYALVFVFVSLLAITRPANGELGSEWSFFDTGSDGSLSPDHLDFVVGDEVDFPNGETSDGRFDLETPTIDNAEPSPLFDDQPLDHLAIDEQDSHSLLFAEMLGSPDASDGVWSLPSFVADNSDCHLDAELGINKRQNWCPLPLTSEEKTQTGNVPPPAIPDPGKALDPVADIGAIEIVLEYHEQEKESYFWMEYTPSFDDDDSLCGPGVFTVCDSGQLYDRIPPSALSPYWILRDVTESK
jgi:hypothetical protein